MAMKLIHFRSGLGFSMVLQDGKRGLRNSKGSGLKAESADNRHLPRWEN